MGDLDRIEATCALGTAPTVEVMAAIRTGTWTWTIDTNRLLLTNGDRTVVFATT